MLIINSSPSDESSTIGRRISISQRALPLTHIRTRIGIPPLDPVRDLLRVPAIRRSRRQLPPGAPQPVLLQRHLATGPNPRQDGRQDARTRRPPARAVGDEPEDGGAVHAARHRVLERDGRDAEHRAVHGAKGEDHLRDDHDRGDTRVCGS